MDYNMPPVEGIDWEKAYHYLPAKEVLMDVLVEFVKTASKQSDKLIGFKEAVSEDASDDNFTSFRIQAHAMKASLRSLGSDLFDKAFALETAGRENDNSAIQSDTESFTAEYIALAERLKVIVGDCDVKADFDETTFFDKLREIKAAMDGFEITALQEAFRTVSDMDYPEKFSDRMDELETAVRELDGDKVTECCDAMAAI